MGAIRGQVAGMVLRESLTLSAWGLLLGLMGAAAAAVLLRQHLFAWRRPTRCPSRSRSRL
jgi:hypothetical protein